MRGTEGLSLHCKCPHHLSLSLSLTHMCAGAPHHLEFLRQPNCTAGTAGEASLSPSLTACRGAGRQTPPGHYSYCLTRKEQKQYHVGSCVIFCASSLPGLLGLCLAEDSEGKLRPCLPWGYITCPGTWPSLSAALISLYYKDLFPRPSSPVLSIPTEPRAKLNSLF